MEKCPATILNSSKLVHWLTSWLLDCLVVILIALLFGFLVRYAVKLTALLFGFLVRYAVILTALLLGFLARYADCLSNTTCPWMSLPSFASILTSSRTVSAFLNWHLNTALGCPDSKCFFYCWAEQGVCVWLCVCVCVGGGVVCVCPYACLCVCLCAFMVLSACICFMFGQHVHGFTVARWSVFPGFSCLETCLTRPSSWDWRPSRLNTQASITSRQPTMLSSANSSAMASVWWVLHADY